MNVFPVDSNNSFSNFSLMTPLSIATLRNVTATELCQMVVYSLLGCMVCFGNLLTIVAVYRTQELRTTPNMHIVSLACSDFLTGAIFPFYMSSSIPSVTVFLNQSRFNCACRYALLYMFLSESFLSILAIALDRFIYIMYPLRYYIYFNPTRTGLIILVTWCISACVGLCTYFTSTWPGHCSFFHVLSRTFQLYAMVPYMFTIFIIIAVLYGCITRQAIRQRRRIRVSHSPGSCLSYKSTFRSVRLFVVVYAVFVLCWLPAGAVVITGYTRGVTLLTSGICLSLGLINSGMNFVMYALMNKAFRRAFVRIFLRCVSCRNCY